jgi:hypothetical protein
MQPRNTWRTWTMLPMTLLIAALLSGFGIPTERVPVRNNAMKSALHQAVFRFDTRIVFSCEEFAREMAARPLVNMTMHIEAQWERIKTDSHVSRSSVHASPECLVQAGLMVL